MTQRHIPTCREVFKRIGETYERNLLWLAEFAAMPLKSLEEPQRIDLLENVFAFCLLSSSAPLKYWRERLLWSLWNLDSPTITRKRWHEVESLQVVARDALEAATDRQPLRLPKLRMEMEIDFSKWSPGDTRPTAPEFYFRPPVRPGDSWEGAFIYRVACVLIMAGEHLGHCQSETCKQPLRLFVRSKSDQQYCSNTCRSREAMKDKRQRDKAQRLAEQQFHHNKKSVKTKQKKKVA